MNMSTSDIIGLCDILVTIFVGFFLTHRFSVRDTRTRSVKDYYISELTSIRKNIEETFQNLLDDKLSAKDLVKWTEDVEARLREFDDGLRIVLPVYARPLQDEVGDMLDILTDIDNINEQFDKVKLELSTDACIAVRNISNDIHEIFAQYLYLVNMANSYGFIEELKKRYNSTKQYFHATTQSIPTLKTICLIFWQYVKEYFWIITFIIAVLFLICKFNRKNETISSLGSKESSIKGISLKNKENSNANSEKLIFRCDTFPRSQYYFRPKYK